MLNFRDEKLTFEETPLGLVLKGEEISSSLTDLGQSVLDPPDLSLVPETVLSDQLQLLIETGLLERTTWGRVDLRVVGRDAVVHHRERPIILLSGQNCKKTTLMNAFQRKKEETEAPRHEINK